MANGWNLDELIVDIEKRNNDAKRHLETLDWMLLPSNDDRLATLQISIVHTIKDLSLNFKNLAENKDRNWEGNQFEELQKETINMLHLVSRQLSNFVIDDEKKREHNNTVLLVHLKPHFSSEKCLIFSKFNLLDLSLAKSETEFYEVLLKDILLNNITLQLPGSLSYNKANFIFKNGIIETERTNAIFGVFFKKTVIEKENNIENITIETDDIVKMMTIIKNPNTNLSLEDVRDAYFKLLSRHGVEYDNSKEGCKFKIWLAQYRRKKSLGKN